MNEQKKLKIFFVTVDGVGHINACVGLAQPLKKRGHNVIFITNQFFSGTFKKFGFEEIVLKCSKVKEVIDKDLNKKSDLHPAKAMVSVLDNLRKIGFLSNKSSIEKLRSFKPYEDNEFATLIYENVVDQQPQLVKLIEDEKPDLFIVDHFILPPCILYGNIPWILLCSAAPLIYYNSPDLPPMMSGYPTNDQTKWKEFRDQLEKISLEGLRYSQNLVNEKFGFPKIENNNSYFKSPYLNIHGYPKELDYSDVIEIPDNHVQVDAFCREINEKFELPEEFQSKIHKDDKLIYLSMGSIGCIDVDLMKRLVKELSTSKHKFIISTGPLCDEYKLSENNMWGKAYLPQTNVLPLVDLVITHGGNNTVTESFRFGKPMIVLPLFGDQYDNAQRIHEKGYGYRLNPYDFNDNELNETIDKIFNDKKMLERCRKAYERISRTNSKEKACERIEQFMHEFQNKQ